MVSGADNHGNAGAYGDTTNSKIFVGGLAWETTQATMRRYFERFGVIVEAVVITDKYTGRSKGYGFVTFEDPESAARACQNPSPVIDGRRTNCNIAAFRLPRSKPQPYAPKNGLDLSAAGTKGLLGPISNQATQFVHRPLSMYSGPPQQTYSMNRHAVCYNWQQLPMDYTPGAPGYSRIYYGYYPFYAPFLHSTLHFSSPVIHPLYTGSECSILNRHLGICLSSIAAWESYLFLLQLQKQLLAMSQYQEGKQEQQNRLANEIRQFDFNYGMDYKDVMHIYVSRIIPEETKNMKKQSGNSEKEQSS